VTQACILAAVAFFPWAAVTFAAPQLLSRPGFQGPVEGEPDDLLLLSGSGFSSTDAVVYERLGNSTTPLRSPADVPDTSSAERGVAPIVSHADVPHSLTLRLPEQLARGEAYVLWVRSADGNWSPPVTINDPRPQWFTPAQVRATQSTAGLERRLKVVGRNLDTGAQRGLKVRLTGPETVTLDALPAPSDGRQLAGVAIEARLPALLRTGRYAVAIGREGQVWRTVEGQQLVVVEDRSPGIVVAVDEARFGGCRPNDDRDDATCVVNAIAAAVASGGIVEFPAGTWDLIDPPVDPGDDGEGILVPRGVRLRGVTVPRPQIVRHPQWHRVPNPAFTLQGSNEVSGLHFRDSTRFDPRDRAGPSLKLGEDFRKPAPPGPAADPTVSDIVVTDNEFDRTWVAIEDDGRPISRLFVTRNLIGAYRTGLELGGNRFVTAWPFRIEDSVIASNEFRPGAYLSVTERQGAMASELGAGRRVDFSDNRADGSSTAYLDDPADARGWRAAFFWHLNGNQEQLLIAGNEASCTGDKVGDGEAIAFDNNGNTFGFDAMQTVIAATANSVTVRGTLRTRQNDRDVPAERYYLSHWVQVGEGPGRGQARPIRSYTTDSRTGAVTFTVDPAWDVEPRAMESRMAVGREFWQVLAVGNSVDNRSPACRKSNRSDRRAGGIILWGQMTDSSIRGNRQFDSDGIWIQQLYNAPGRDCPQGCYPSTHFLTATSIRRNEILGEYDADNACSWSGIMGSAGASPTAESPPPTVSYGLDIAHNTVTGADGWNGGSIEIDTTWHEGPPPGTWPLVSNTLIHHNELMATPGVARRGCLGRPVPERTGINLGATRLARGTTLYANQCRGYRRGFVDPRGTSTRSCAQAKADSCECAK
jgi:hypothetical protein